MIRTEINVLTGEVTTVEMSAEEVAALQAQEPPSEINPPPLEKLKAFLTANPDVVELLA